MASLLKKLMKTPQFRRALRLKDLIEVLSKTGPIFPIGLYLVDEDGYFQYCNDTCRNILGIPTETKLGKKSILDYYVRPDLRRSLIQQLEQQNGRLCQQVIEFHKQGSDKIIYVEDNCQRVEDKSRPGHYYYVGSLTDITDSYQYRQLFDDLSSGVFRINRSNRIEMANQAVANIFGFASVEEMKENDISARWKNKKDFEKYIKTLEKEKQVNNYLAEMIKKDGSSVFISINSKLWRDENKRILGREGTFTDITNETKIRQTFQQFSIGYYEIQTVGGRDIIFHCNQAFVKIFGYDTKDEVLGADISTFHYDEEARAQFFQNIQQAEKTGQNLFNKIQLRAKKKDGAPFWVQVDFVLKRDHKNRIVGREGILVDINERVLMETELREKQKQLKNMLADFDKFVHQYIAPVMNIDSTSQRLMEILQKRLTKTYASVSNIDIKQTYLMEIIQNIDHFLEVNHLGAFNERLLDKLRNFNFDLKEAEKIYRDPDLHELRIRGIIFDMLDVTNALLKDAPQNNDAYYYLKNIRKNVVGVYDIFILKLQKRILDITEITHNVIEGLRRYLFTGEEPKFDFAPTNIIKIIKDNIEMFYNMARQKGLTIIPPKQNYISMEISSINVDRMVSNLLLNAIKYSYKRQGGYIEVRVLERKQDVEIQIENYGVPVEKDEIDNVFEYGYRGVKSYDWNRLGSGIGLADAKNTVQKHGGDIYLTSRPAGQPDPTMSRERFPPYITTVYVTLPKRREQ